MGIMAYELICGKRPYPEDDPVHMMDLHCQQEIPDPAEITPDLPDELRQFIIKCCYIDPDRRYQTADEALAALQQLSEQLSIGQVKEKYLLTSVFMIYPEMNRQALTRLLEEFNSKAADIGITMKINETMDI